MSVQALPLPWSNRVASRRRQKILSGSLATSGALLERKWFGGKDRGSPCLMKFHREWQHPDCPVMKWYGLQQPSSTVIRSIEHRKENDPPFYHEFLILRLSDKALCRVERIGEGSRIDAIRNIGCTAYDYIQYFPPGTSYESDAQDNRSELIAEVCFQNRDFDIMDVLAICYAIFMRPRTRVYTLQRFNCYFLCGTILLVLTRRLMTWEAGLTFDVWRNALHQSLDRLTDISRSPEAAKEHLVLNVCRLLEPGTPVPAEFIFQALRNHLGTGREAYNSLRRTLARTLWRTAWNGSMHHAIADHVNAAVALALKEDGNCARALNSATYDSKKVLRERFESFSEVNSIINKKAIAALSDGLHVLTRATKEHYRMEKIENPHTVLQEIWITVATHVVGAWFPFQMLLSGDMEEWGFKGEYSPQHSGTGTKLTI